MVEYFIYSQKLKRGNMQYTRWIVETHMNGELIDMKYFLDRADAEAYVYDCNTLEE